MHTKRIMIVDDSDFARLAVKSVVSEHLAFEICGAARDGEEALEMFESVKPDLIILDLEMPKVDGIEFIKRARNATTAKILIFTTNSGRINEALEAGADGACDKPAGSIFKDLAGHEERSKLLSVIEELLYRDNA